MSLTFFLDADVRISHWSQLSCTDNLEQKICGRLAFHCENGDSLSDTASSIASSEAEFNLEEWKHQAGWRSQAKNNWRMNFL